MKVTALHMRREEPNEPNEGRKFDKVKVSGALDVELEVAVRLPSVKVRPFSGQAEPE